MQLVSILEEMLWDTHIEMIGIGMLHGIRTDTL